MTTKLDRVWNCAGGTTAKSLDILIMQLVTLQIKKINVCTSKISMATKLGRVVTYGWKTPLMWYFDYVVTWQMKKIVSITYNLRLEDPTHEVMWSFDHVVTWKIRNFYLYFSNIYGNQTWQSRSLGWETQSLNSSHVNIWPSSHVVIIC